MDINTFNDAWVEAGQKVSDLDAQLNAAVLDDAFDTDKFAQLKSKRDAEKTRRDAIKSQLDEARALEIANMNAADKKPLNDEEQDIEAAFVGDFKNMLRGRMDKLSGRFNMTGSNTDNTGNGGLTIPKDVQYAIHKLVRQFASLQGLVNVESVTTTSGTRVYEKWSEITPLANLDDEKGLITDNDDPQLTIISYTIKRYAGITTVTNSLLKDTVDNIMAWLSTWIARKVVVTRNTAILAVLNKATKKPTITKFDDIKDMVIKSLDPAIEATSSFVTNVSGFAVLAKVKDAMGRYLLQRDPTNADQWTLAGKRVTVIGDRWLPDVSNSHPLYYGDFKQAITLFDRESMSLVSTNIGGGAFEHDLTKVRVIDRFDVEQTDGDAYMVGSFTTIADQPANFAAAPKTAG